MSDRDDAGVYREGGHEFDCPLCDHHARYRYRWLGAFFVTGHFFVRHPITSFKVGFPLSGVSAPDFEEDPGEDSTEEVVTDGGRPQSPYDTEAEKTASQILHHLRKPESVRTEDDRDYIIDQAESLAREVLGKDE